MPPELNRLNQAARPHSREGGSSGLNFVRYATQHPRPLMAFVVTGLIAGVAYRSFADAPDTRDLANHLRSGVHGPGCANTARQSINAWSFPATSCVR